MCSDNLRLTPAAPDGSPPVAPPVAHTSPLVNTNRDLELTGPTYRRFVENVVNRLETHLSSLGSQPASHEDAQLPRPDGRLPREPAGLDDVLDHLFSQVVPSGYNTTSPGFLGYFGGGGLPHAAVADLISGTVNRFVGRWAAAPAAVQLEADVIRWLVEIVGYPDAAGGVLTSGGSMSNLTALFTARRHQLPAMDLRKVRFYASEQSHFSLQKAAMVCGLPPESLRAVPCDAQGCMDTAALDRLIREDRESGHEPFLVVATGGTFGAGAVDDIEAIADITQRENLWLHLDAAYGGFFVLTAEGRRLLAGMARCHSITLDPHKSLFLPYGTGALLVRDGRQLGQAHAIDADFYGPMQDDQSRIDFCSLAMEQTRPWRGLRLWLPLKMHGIEPFTRNLEEKLALSRHAAEALRGMPGIELVVEPILSVLAFRLVRPGLGAEALKQLNQKLLDRINRQKNIFLMGTMVKGVYALRMCTLSFRTHLDHIEGGLAAIRQAVLDTQREEPTTASVHPTQGR